MKRWLRRIAVSLSLVVFLVSASLWIAGFLIDSVRAEGEVVIHYRSGNELVEQVLSTQCSAWELRIEWETLRSPDPSRWPARTWPGIRRSRSWPGPFAQWSPTWALRLPNHRFEAWSDAYAVRAHRVYGWGVELPMEGVMLISGLLPARLLIRADKAWRRRRAERRARRRSVCVNCGYDLRASEDVCPECGCAIPEDLNRMKTTETAPSTAAPPRRG